MRQQLEPIINKLISDPLFGVRITNADTLKVICTNKTGLQMTEEAGSVEDYFNRIVVNEGNVNLMIQPRRKNGSTYKDAGDPVLIRTSAPKSPVQQQFEFQPTLNQNQPDMTGLSYPAIPMSQNNAGNLLAGLNGMDVAYRYQDYPKIVLENERLKLENETQRKEILKLEREALQNEFAESKAAGNKEMLSGLVEQLPLLLQGFMAIKGGGAPAGGLGTPAGMQEDLSPVKSQLIQLVQNNNDSIVYYVLQTLNGINTNEAFGQDLVQILEKHQIITKQNG